MPDPHTPTPTEIENLRRSCVDQARAALQARDERGRRRRALGETQAEDGPPSLTSTHVVYVLAALAVIGIDILLLAPTAEYVVGGAFPDNPSLATAAKFLLPVFVVLLELVVAMQIHKTWQNLREARYDVSRKASSSYRSWWWIGAVFVCFMPLLALSSQLAELGTLLTTGDSANTYVQLSFLVKAIALTILAFTAHALFIFGGRYIVESKEALLAYFSTSPEEQFQEAQERFERLQDEVLDTFAQYHRAITGFNENHDRQISAGPFPESVRRLINDGYGRDILETPPPSSTHGSASGDGVAGPPSEPPTPGLNGPPRLSEEDSSSSTSADTDGDDGPDRSTPATGDRNPNDAGNAERDPSGEDEDPDDYRDLHDEQRRDDADGALRP